jgi:hypothetical protein
MHAEGQKTSSRLAEGVREANERIALQAERYHVRLGIPMLCECGDPACSELFLVSLAGYRQARREAAFLIAPGHGA